MSFPSKRAASAIPSRGNAIKKCWKRRWKETKPCDEPYHPKSCEVSIYAYDGGTKLVYEKAGRVKRSYAQNMDYQLGKIRWGLAIIPHQQRPRLMEFNLLIVISIHASF